MDQVDGKYINIDTHIGKMPVFVFDFKHYSILIYFEHTLYEMCHWCKGTDPRYIELCPQCE